MYCVLKKTILFHQDRYNLDSYENRKLIHKIEIVRYSLCSDNSVCIHNLKVMPRFKNVTFMLIKKKMEA